MCSLFRTYAGILANKQLSCLRNDTLASRNLILSAEHHLRCSELALLTRDSLDLGAGLLRLSRKKGDKWQLHQPVLVTSTEVPRPPATVQAIAPTNLPLRGQGHASPGPPARYQQTGTW